MLAVDYVCFGTGMAFLGPTTVLPTLVRFLGGSPLAVGSLGAIQSGAFLLPQLYAGRAIAHRPLVKGYVVTTGAISRACLALAVPALWLLSVRAPGWALASLLLSYTVFNVVDALSTVGWFDLLGKAIPPDRRGRALGVGQVLLGLSTIGAGLAVKAILGRPTPFPGNYVLLVAIAVALFAICPVAIAQMREPRGVAQGEEQPPWRQYLPRVISILRMDPAFAWLTMVRWLAGLADMGAAFYVLFAVDRLRMPQDMLGLFISAGMAGSMLSGILLGPLGDRRGSHSVITVIMALRCLGPFLALLAPLVAALHPWLGPAIFLLIFAIAGMAGGAYMVGFMSYLLEIAPPGQRSTYGALANTLGGLLLVAPLLAGWLVEVASYEALFAVTLAAAVVGLALAWRGPSALARPVPSW